MLVGCGTMMRFSDKSESKRAHKGQYYAATKIDIAVFRAPYSDAWFGAIAYWFYPFALIDLPISLAADTLLIPYDVYQDYKWYEDRETRNNVNAMKIQDPIFEDGVN